jgi:hypothetical protein
MNTNNISQKENDYSLDNLDNYYKTFNCDTSEILNKYTYLMNEYLKFILEKTKIKNNNYFKFVITRGYDTITNVFNNILYCTKNLDLTFYHCQKSYYYYIEFIEQISEEQHVFLQLSSRDAATYVYKKTLLDLNHEVKTMEPCSNEIIKIIKTMDEEIKIFRIIFDFIIENLYLDNSLNINLEIIDKYQTVCRRIVISKLEIEKIIILYKTVENINKDFLSSYNENITNKNKNHYILFDKYFESILKILKKARQNNNTIDF